jgi:hypothetical protein
MSLFQLKQGLKGDQMKNLGLLLLTLLTLNSSFAGDYYTNCYVRDGKAIALFCAQSSASGSGTGSIDVFDIKGRLIDSEMSIWIGIAIMGCDEVDSVDVDEDAVFCVFNP